MCDLTSGDVGNTEKQIRYWVPSLKLQYNDKNIITSGQWLANINMHSAQKIMREQFGHINGFQDTVLAPTFDDKSQTWTQGDNSFQPQPKPSAQIHSTGHSHWAISFQVMDDDKVYVLDSLYNYLSVSMQIQMSQIYRNCRNTENIINVSIPSKFNKQMQGSDCGLFAVANLVEYCFGRYDEIIKGGTIGWEFKQCEMRGHLVKCLQNLQFQSFPKVQKRRAIKIIHVAYDLKVWCVCGMFHQC